MTEDRSFAQLVSLGCHDLRTPLATVHGFARTLVAADLGDPAARYVQLMEGASAQLAELVDRISLAAQIEGGRYQPQLAPVDLMEVARTAAERVQEGRVTVTGGGGTTFADAAVLERAVGDLARCVIRPGGVSDVSLRVDDGVLELAPVSADVAPIVLGQNVRDLGAVVAARAIEALGGSITVESERLVVRLAAGQAAEGAALPAGS